MKSKITGGPTEFLFTARILNKYDVKYYRCTETGFIQTEEPYWLEEAYSSAITKLDVGLVRRNEILRDVVGKIIVKNFDAKKSFLDYAGGYGLFTRMMRDQGLSFYHTDKYCANIFAEYFDLARLDNDHEFEAVTAFEVLEHMTNPKDDLKEILSLSDSLLFTTELVPREALSDWWYLSLETGQHVSFYTEKALGNLGKQLGRNYYTDGKWLHLLTKRTFGDNPLKIGRLPFLLRKMNKLISGYYKNRYPFPESLLGKDTDFIKSQLL